MSRIVIVLVIYNKLGTYVAGDPGLYKTQVITYSGLGATVWCTAVQYEIGEGEGGRRQLNSDNYEQRTKSMNTPL
jgi:hypothetical protein